MAPSAVGQKPRAVARAFPADQLLLYSNGVCFIVATIALILYAGNATGRVYYRAFWQIISLSLSLTHTQMHHRPVNYFPLCNFSVIA
jgi:hypothetical protein